MTRFINKKLIFYLLCIGLISYNHAMEQSISQNSIAIAQQLKKAAQDIVEPQSTITLDTLNVLSQKLCNDFTQAEWNNGYETAQKIRNSINLSLLDNLMRVGAHEALTHLATILTPVQNESPLPCYTKIQQALTIPQEVYHEIAQARTTGCFKELLALKQQPTIAGTFTEEFLTKTIVELMDGLYPISSLVDLSFCKSAHFFNTFVKTNQWEKIKEGLTALPEDLRIKLINLPVNQAQETLLYLYTQQENDAVVKELLELGADANLRNCADTLPLTLASCNAANKLIQLLTPFTEEYIGSMNPKYGLYNKKSLENSKIFEHTPTTKTILEGLRQAWVCNNSETIPFWIKKYDNFQDPLFLNIFIQSPYGYRVLSFINDKQFKKALLKGALKRRNIVLVKRLILDGIRLPNSAYSRSFFSSESSIENLNKLMHLLWDSGLPCPEENSFNLQGRSILHRLIHCYHDKSYTILNFLCEKNYKFNLTACDPTTSLEDALIETNAFFINFIIHEAQRQNINVATLINAQRLLSRSRGDLRPLKNVHHIFLVNFLNIIAHPDIPENEKFSCIQILANLPFLQEITPNTEEEKSSKQDYDTFISLCSFDKETINFSYPQALNLALNHELLSSDIIEFILKLLEKKQIALTEIIDDKINERFFSECTNRKISKLVQLQTLHQETCKIFYENLIEPSTGKNILHKLLDDDMTLSTDSYKELVKDLLTICPSLKSKQDLYGKTPLDYIQENEELSKNQELVALFK